MNQASPVPNEPQPFSRERDGHVDCSWARGPLTAEEVGELLFRARTKRLIEPARPMYSAPAEGSASDTNCQVFGFDNRMGQSYSPRKAILRSAGFLSP